MPLAIINGVLRDQAGLPTAQLVAAGTQGQDSESWARRGWFGGLGSREGCSFSWEETWHQAEGKSLKGRGRKGQVPGPT